MAGLGLIAAPDLVFLLQFVLYENAQWVQLTLVLFSLWARRAFDILHENELVVAVISLLPPITLGENASH